MSRRRALNFHALRDSHALRATFNGVDATPSYRVREFRGRRGQRGVALIIALILVALATILATKLTFDGFLERRRAIGVMAAEQALHFGLGAEALAADALAQDQQMNASQTTLAAPWAQPTQPLPITPQDDPEGEPIGTLQGQVEDMQGRFNLNNLARVIPNSGAAGNATGVGGVAGAATTNNATLYNGVTNNGTQGPIQDPQPLEQFQRLLIAVGLEPKWAAIARDWIDADDTPGSPDGAEDSVYTSQTPPYRTGNWPMMSPTELMNLPGFGADRYRKIAPFVTALPGASVSINICTAPSEVLESLAPNLNGEYSPQVLAAGRKTGCFPELNAFNNVIGPKELATLRPGLFGTTSNYFRLTTRITLGTTEFTLYSLLLRGNGKITPLLRSFGTP
jgi:general secretion pathway protein K